MRKRFKTLGMLLLTATVAVGWNAVYAAPASGQSSFEAPDEVCTGQVVDETGEPVIGAAVKAKGSLGGVVTDVNGEFRLNNVAIGTPIEVNYIGYQDASVAWDGKPMTITLVPSN